MASQSLYRKWRSQTFAEVVGQEPIVLTLRNSLSTGRIAHAYLFCGPRGTGKTSSGRILAKALNCSERKDGEPCNICEMCRSVAEGRAFDLVEIDAASNRGIDEIRDLREKVRFVPSQGRYKVYIIDEVHMLTTDAFNALLKTLEEPPAHVIFVLCTTEAHKVPATVMSRCQRFDFRRISLAASVGRLRYICEQEGIQVDDAALELVAKASSGSLRDAENLVDQLIAYYSGGIGVEQVRDLLGMAGDARTADLAGHLVRGDLPQGLRVINDVVADGHDLRQFNRELVDYLRRLLLVQIGSASLVEASKEELADLEALARLVSTEELLRATKLFSQLDLRYDGQSPLPLELALVECLIERSSAVERHSDAASLSRHSEAAAESFQGKDGVAGTPVSPDPSLRLRVTGEMDEPPAAYAGTGAGDRPEAPELADSDPLAYVKLNWGRVLKLLHTENRTLENYIVYRNAHGPVAVEENRVILGVGYKIHKDSLEKPLAKKTIEGVLRRSLGREYVAEYVVLAANDEERKKRAAEDPLIQEALKQGARIVEVE